MTKPVDNDPLADRQERNSETASDASDTPPPDDEPAAPEPDEPEPDDDEDPEVEPAKPGRRAKWRIKAFVNSMYRDPNFPWPSVEWRKKTPKGSDMPVIDVGDDDNRMAALALVGVCDLTSTTPTAPTNIAITDPTNRHRLRRSPSCGGSASPTCGKKIERP